MLPLKCSLVLLLLVGTVTVASRDVEFKNCKPSSGSFSCKVKSVEVKGCLKPSTWVDQDGVIVEYHQDEMKQPCRLERGSSLNFTILFEPGFTTETVRSQFTIPDMPECWGALSGRDPPSYCPVVEPASLGCASTKCPLMAGRKQPFDSTLFINPSLPGRPINDRKVYQMRWKLWSNKDKKNHCCFNFPIQY